MTMLESGIPTSSEPVPTNKSVKPPLMPAMAMQVRPDLYASAIAPLAKPVLGRQGGEAAVDAGNGDAGETDLYASTIANWQNQYWTTGRRSRR
jgi:hypothetical protein